MIRIWVFATMLVLGLTVWLNGAKRGLPVEAKFVTSFDFGQYRSCAGHGRSNCIQAIRFYDADSARLLAEVPVSESIQGSQRIVGTARLNFIPRHAYAVTVYRDELGRRREGPRGQISDFTSVRP